MPVTVTPGQGRTVVITRTLSSPRVTVSPREVTVSRPADNSVAITRAPREVVVQNGGMQGPQGEPGAGGDSVAVVRVAAQTLGGHRIVRASGDGEADYADVTNDAHADDILGLTTHAASAAAAVQILTNGSITEPSWNWTPGLPLWLAENGLMTHSPAEDVAFVIPVGFAETATSVFIDIGTPIYY